MPRRVEAGHRQAVLARAVLDEPIRNADIAASAREAARRPGTSLIALPAPPATTFSSTVTIAAMRRGEPRDQFLVERLHESHVDQRRVEPLGDALARRHHRAEREQRSPLRPSRRTSALPTGSARIALDAHAGALAARIAHGGGPSSVHGGVEHLPAFVLVGGRHDDQIRNAAQVGQVVAPWCVAPSPPTRPARSIANVTGSFCSATSWISWS